ncbi:MAG TPA: hypothetical protein VF314_16985 [Actinomycetes bacterium]
MSKQGAARAAAVVLLVVLGGTVPAAAAEDPHAHHGAGHSAGHGTGQPATGQPATEHDHSGDQPADPPQDHNDHGGRPDAVSTSRRTAVLSGFGAVNSAVLAGALLMRRRARRTGRRTARGNHR